MPSLPPTGQFAKHRISAFVEREGQLWLPLLLNFRGRIWKQTSNAKRSGQDENNTKRFAACEAFLMR